jgi:hypothetical protein
MLSVTALFIFLVVGHPTYHLRLVEDTDALEMVRVSSMI